MSNSIGGTSGAQGMQPMDTQGVAGAGGASQSASASTPLAGASSAVDAGGGAAPATSSSSIAGTDTFLKLLVAQMRNQDPSQPMDDQSFVTELAQFNTVEQVLGLKEAVTAQIAAQQSAEGVALLGKTVTYTAQGVGDTATSSQGIVSGVSLQGGSVQLQVGADSVPLGKVTSVSAQ